MQLTPPDGPYWVLPREITTQEENTSRLGAIWIETVCVRVCLCLCLCVQGVCVRDTQNEYICIYMCVCMKIFVCSYTFAIYT